METGSISNRHPDESRLYHRSCKAEYGHFQEEHLTELEFCQLLHQRIEALDVGAARASVSKFVKDVNLVAGLFSRAGKAS